MRPLMLSCVCARVHLCRRVVARVGVGSVLQMWALYYKCGRGPSTTNAHRYNCLGTRKALPRPKRRVPARTERRCTRASTPPRMHATADREHCSSV